MGDQGEAERSAQRRYRRSPEIIVRRIGGETVLVPVRETAEPLSHIYALNETGAFIWQLLDGEHSIADLVHELVEHYEVSREEAAADIETLLSQLQAARTILEV